MINLIAGTLEMKKDGNIWKFQFSALAVSRNAKKQNNGAPPALFIIGIKRLYPVHVMTRKSFGLMTRKLSVTESQRSAQFPGTFSRRKLSVASANWAQVA